jgi:hypothetical protein
MIFSFTEIPDSRSSTLIPPTYTYKYLASGEPNDALVQLFALSATPLVIATLVGPIYRQDAKLEPDGFARYIVTVPYARQQLQPGSYTINFETTGATENRKLAITHINDYATSGTPTNHQGSIGVNAQGECEGVNVVLSSLKISISFRHPQGSLNQTYIRAVASITGSVNSDSFLGFQADELLFLGATCSQGANSDGSSAETNATYQFAADQNRTGVSFAGPDGSPLFSGVSIKGHEYAWADFKSAVVGGNAIMLPNFLHVEQVYPRNAFGSVFPFGS